jgi:hypothetical protein
MRTGALLACGLLLGACQTAERAAAPDAVPAASAEDLAAYLARLRAMNEGGVAAEAARQKQDSARAPAPREAPWGPDDLGRLKAALALALAPQSEESEILALVDPIAAKAGTPADVRVMASFLQVFANDRRRLKESAAAARTSLRDERRALETQKQRADALQDRATQLQQKLDALTALEKSLSDRPLPSR